MSQSKDGEHILRFWTQFGNNIGYRFTEDLVRCKIPRRSPPNIIRCRSSHQAGVRE